MKLSTTTLLSLALFASHTEAQTTGVPTTNDLTVNTFGSGATSSMLAIDTLNLPTGTFTFEVTTTTTDVPVFFLISLGSVSPPIFLPPQTSCAPPIPFNGPSNQWFDLDVFSDVIPVMVTSSSGIATFSFPIDFAIDFSVQGVVLHPCAGGLFPVLMTQAFNVSVT